MEGCLIVQVVDHRCATAATDSRSNSTNDTNVPFSIHNHNENLTPSPYVPYPGSNESKTEGPDTAGEGAASAAKVVNGEPPAQTSASVQGSKTNEQARKFTTVLFPTPESLQAEVAYYATTPDPRSVNRKQSTTGGVPRTPASATMPHPPTPLSAVPSTPVTPGPPNKKQKMLVGTIDIRNFESRIVDAVAGPLFLDPVDSLQEAQKLMGVMTDSRHKEDYPAPKTRKRTVAELAADEALAAQEQRFMLIMDERLAPSASAGAAGKASVGDGEVGAAGFEPRFERFKLIEQIKAELQAKKQRDREQAEQRNAIQTAAKAKQDRENEARHLREQQQLQEQHRQAQEHARLETLQQMKQNQNQTTILAMQQQEQRRRQQQAVNQHQGSPPPNGVIPTTQPHMVPASQAHQSPVVRDMTPHSNSSPTVGHVNHAGQSQPMKVTSSAQGVTSSPARPSSAMQHGHPQPNGVSMVRQHSAQGPSRRGTPQMPNGTPSMPHGTPVVNTSTPVSRMAAHGSPPNTVNQTPVMAPNTIAAQHIGMGSQGLTPEQFRSVQAERERQVALAQAQRHQNHQQHQLAQQMQNGHPAQMSPERLQLQYAQQQQQALRLQAQAQQQAYQENIRKQQHQQMAGHIGSPHPGQPQPQPGQPPHGHPGQPRPVPNQAQLQMQQVQHKAYQAKYNEITQRCGGSIPPDKLAAARTAAQQYAQQAGLQYRQNMAARANEYNEQRRRMMMQAQMGGMGGQMNGGMNGQVNGMNGMGIGGVNGIGMQ